jgi:hypothetical protein
MAGIRRPITLRECIADALAAILRGDYDERDRLCALAETAFGDGNIAAGDAPVRPSPEQATSTRAGYRKRQRAAARQADRNKSAVPASWPM